jgi:threonine/homoserine/homoserine lactone efflux protein
MCVPADTYPLYLPGLVSLDRLAAFAAMSLLICVIPGPSVLFVIGRALAHGRGVALTSVAGNTLGSYVLVTAVALGVGPVVERSAVLFAALKLAGAAYLVHLGVKALRQRKTLLLTAGERREPRRGPLRTLGEGFMVGVSNPKTMVFYAAVLPQFVDRAAGQVAGQMLLLGLIFNGIALVSDSAVGLAASAARSWFARSPKRLSMVGGAGGLAMIGLGVTVAATGRGD